MTILELLNNTIAAVVPLFMLWVLAKAIVRIVETIASRVKE
jgi:hypothetical protein